MTKLGPYILGPNDTPENGIYLGDARVLAEAIPDESIDLVFTDPIYQRIDDYRWLAETGARVLRPEGALLCWSNGKWHRDNANWLESYGLIYRWTFACVISNASSPMNGKIIAKTSRVIWCNLGGPRNMRTYLADGYLSIGGAWNIAKGTHKWGKSAYFTQRMIECFTDHDAIIFDPFTGGGTVPAVCKILGRQYLAFEILPDVAEMARERVRNTQPPLFVQREEQLELME